jgi:hypothetical protein
LKAGDLADLREERDGGDEPDAWDRHEPLGLWGVDGEPREIALDLGDLFGQEVDLPQRRIEGVALVLGQRLLGEPQPPCDTEGV